jgi:ClpP class serine protease
MQKRQTTLLRITSTQQSRKIQSIPFSQLRNLSTQSPLKRKAKPRLHLADNRINAKKTNNFASLHLHGAIADKQNPSLSHNSETYLLSLHKKKRLIFTSETHGELPHKHQQQ